MCAADKWTTTDKALEAVFVTATVIDWGQTLYIADHPNQFDELNPILGKYPSRARVNIYFPVVLVAHAVISNYLPKPYRTIWQSFSIAVEVPVIGNNYALGIKLGF